MRSFLTSTKLTCMPDSWLLTGYWSTVSCLPCQGVYLLPLPDRWLPSWLPHAVFLISAHLVGFACVASDSNMDPAVGLVTAQPCCRLLHWCVPFLTKPLAHTSPLPCLSQWPTSELTSSPTYSASLSSSPALALSLDIFCSEHQAGSITGHCLMYSVLLLPWNCFFNYSIRG